MNTSDILAFRLQNQYISGPHLNSPEEIVDWLGAIQAQDFIAAKWAIGLRSESLNDKQIVDALNQGKILRTHILRPTWHFVTQKDIRWMLDLTAPRIRTQSAYYYRHLELDDRLLRKSTEILITSLAGRNFLTRAEIKDLLIRSGIEIKTALQLAYIVGYAELEGIICSGPLKGKQHTYALLDERAPEGKYLERDESLAELATRYFQSHGPANVQDFAWWSGLTTSDARKGIELIKSRLTKEKIAENLYWFIPPQITPQRESKIYLLPNYDEYIVAYKDRGFIFDRRHITKLDARANPLFQNTILFNGEVIGTWNRKLKKNSVDVNTNIFGNLDKSQQMLLNQTIEQYREYLSNFVNI